ncbi:MAG TPA: LamG-like jellyroll fold domain-containing protein [Ohtaekwangia sp.]|nr:LamG-like jellyroll fold domain-containing protein [Ohtaekwangia sp.]
MTKYFTALFLSILFSLPAVAQPGQHEIQRVSQMPDLPVPYDMRNWKEVALKYDELVFSTTASGQYFPLINLKPTGINYPEISPVLLQTYVGTTSNNQAEAINIMPAIIGASLVDLDKSNQMGYNWVEKTKDFFNKTNGQQVYLNGYSATSGGDWWYDIMPNIFFYQLYKQYPHIADFNTQFVSVADRWLDAVHAMGGSTIPWTLPQMNYRAWNLMTMTGNAEGVKEPEAAGGIGWLLYHAYLETGEKKYLEGAQMSIGYLSALTANPSYELQLPYGAFIAAKMNAELGTTYDVPKLINWCFNRGPLRGWGSITGTWNGIDVDGLIGEANDAGNDYAFAMNGFQQIAALVPLIKYDKRFARDLAKWALNVANASRLFYPQYLPSGSQDDFAWSMANDPDGVIAYEAIKETWEGKPLYGTGDAKRNGWAQTNLALYGSSHVGYLAAVVEPTDVEGILLLDLNKTDFFKEDGYPSYVLYNPHTENKSVTLTLPSGTHDIYDAISETIIASAVSGNTILDVKSDEALLLVYIPAASALTVTDNRLYVGDEIIDYHYGYDFTGSLRIKSLAAAHTLVEFNQQVPVYTTLENVAGQVTYNWKANEVQLETTTDNTFTWTVPEIAGRVVLYLQIESDEKTAYDSIVFQVVENIPHAPVINAITSDARWYATGTQVELTCNASDDDDTPEELSYHWTIPGGTIIHQDGAILTWQSPDAEGAYDIRCDVTDQDNLTTSAQKLILIKQLASAATPPFAYYPLDGDVNDYSGNNRHAIMSGVDATQDARGEAGKAYLFNSGSDIIYVANSSTLNFQDKITASFWITLNSLTEESFILSHGSWEQRWKVSVTPTARLRWTVKTNNGTEDLDSSFPLQLNQFYHFTVVYSGYTLELYANSELDNFKSHSGQMGTTSNALTFGRKDQGESNYALKGTLDEVRIYNAVLDPNEISKLKTQWQTVTEIEKSLQPIRIYPNPSQGEFFIAGLDAASDTELTVVDVNGRDHRLSTIQTDDHLHVIIDKPVAGLMILKIQTAHGVQYKKLVLK